MGGIALRQMQEMLEKGEGYGFVAIFTWPPEADKVARERFGTILAQFQPDQNADVVPGAAYSLTGARTVLVIGRSKSESALYKFCSSIIFDSGIDANFYHCVDFDEAKGMWPDLEH